MADSVDPYQTAPIGAVCSGPTLFPSKFNSSVMLEDDLSRQHFQMHFFLGALLRVKLWPHYLTSSIGRFNTNILESHSDIICPHPTKKNKNNNNFLVLCPHTVQNNV